MCQDHSTNPVVELIGHEGPEAHTKHYAVLLSAQQAARKSASNLAKVATDGRGSTPRIPSLSSFVTKDLKPVRSTALSYYLHNKQHGCQPPISLKQPRSQVAGTLVASQAPESTHARFCCCGAGSMCHWDGGHMIHRRTGCYQTGTEN